MASQPPAVSLAGLALIAIDDREDALDALRSLLALDDMALRTFTTGRAALAWLEGHDTAQWPDALICDIALGEEDGHAVVRRIRQIEAERGVPLDERTPAIALTGLAPASRKITAGSHSRHT